MQCISVVRKVALRLVGSSDFQIGHDGPGLMEVLRNTMKPRSSCR